MNAECNVVEDSLQQCVFVGGHLIVILDRETKSINLSVFICEMLKDILKAAQQLRKFH